MTGGIATAAGMPFGALVSTNEDMFLKPGHEENVQDLRSFCRGEAIHSCAAPGFGSHSQAALILEWNHDLIAFAEGGDALH